MRLSYNEPREAPYHSLSRPKAAPKCMNCKYPLSDDASGVYGRRFCSEKCRNDYLAR